MQLNMEFEAPSWDEIYEMLLSLADMIKRDSFKPDLIVGVSRGGLPPARVMSDLLGNVELASVRVEFYRGVAETGNEPVITQPISTSVEGKNVLIVDDVADTGKSLKVALFHVMESGAKTVKTATIYYKPWSTFTPDYYVKVTRCWIVFPWERRETVKNLIEKCRRSGASIEEVKRKLVDGGMDRRLLERLIKDVLEGG